jgi:glycosyltransferase involved in cell wall biosynthesis
MSLKSAKSTCIVVLGMHRSGTSALAGCLHALGVDLGDNLVPADQYNEKGHWENRAVVDLNERLLGLIGRQCHDDRLLPAGWEERLAVKQLATTIPELLNSQFNTSRIFGVKDPRLCRLAPLWLPSLRSRAHHIVVLHALRRPEEVARSLERRNGLSMEQGVLQWLMHVLEAERHSREYPRAVVAYETLLEDWRRALMPLQSLTNGQCDIENPQIAARINALLAPGLRHFRRTPSVAGMSGPLLDLANCVYETMTEPGGGAQSSLDQFWKDTCTAAGLIGPWSRRCQDLQFEIESLRTDLALRERRQNGLGVLAEAMRQKGSVRRKALVTARVLANSIVPEAARWFLRPALSWLRVRRRALLAMRQSPPQPYRVRLASPASASRPLIIHAMSNFDTGGSSRLVVDLVENLGEYRHLVLIPEQPKPIAYEGVGITYARTQRQIRMLLRRTNPAVVHVHYWGGTWYRKLFAAIKEEGCAVVENVNTPVQPFLSDAVQRYVYVSEYVRRTFGDSNSPGDVVYPGSDFELFDEARWPATDDQCIGMVYRLERDKLDEHAIDPILHALQKRPNARALIVGSGPLLETYRREVAHAGLAERCHFTGMVRYEDLPALYAQITVFVAPVWKESFGQVTPFAMSMGRPVAGYAVGALREILDDTQCLAAPGDSRRLAEILVELLDDAPRRQELGRRNRERARELFSVEAMIRGYRKIYADVLRLRP